MTAERTDFPFPAAPGGGTPPEARRRLTDDPLATARLLSGDEVTIAVRYADVRQVLSDPRFTRELNYPGAPRQVRGNDLADNPDALINMDPPRHTRLRRIASVAFTPRRVETWRPWVAEVAERLLDELIAGPAPADLIATYALPLPIRVICALLGVPHQDQERFRNWSDAFLSNSAQTAEQRGAAARAFAGYVAELIAERRREPADGLVDALIQARDGREAMTEPELVRMIVGLIIAGHETTATVLGRGVFTLLTHAGQYAALAADPDRVTAAVEEILRYDIPADGSMIRVATEDVPLPSGVVGKGQAVMSSLSAANRDPEVFPDPERFDIARPECPHISFGHGPHFCLGANLARLELQVGLSALVRRLPDLALAVPAAEIPWRTGSVIRGIVRLPVTW